MATSRTLPGVEPVIMPDAAAEARMVLIRKRMAVLQVSIDKFKPEYDLISGDPLFVTRARYLKKRLTDFQDEFNRLSAVVNGGAQ